MGNVKGSKNESMIIGMANDKRNNAFIGTIPKIV